MVDLLFRIKRAPIMCDVVLVREFNFICPANCDKIVPYYCRRFILYTRDQTPTPVKANPQSLWCIPSIVRPALC